MEKKTPPRKGWLRAAALAKGAARLSYAGAILGGLFTLRYQQSEAAPSYTILSGQMRGLLSALYSIFLLFLPLMAVVLSGDLLAAYCRMRGETGRDCSLGDYLGSPEGWTELRHLGSPAALRMFTFGKWQYPWGCDINKGNHRRGGPFGIFRKAPAHKEEKHP